MFSEDHVQIFGKSELENLEVRKDLYRDCFREKYLKAEPEHYFPLTDAAFDLMSRSPWKGDERYLEYRKDIEAVPFPFFNSTVYSSIATETLFTPEAEQILIEDYPRAYEAFAEIREESKLINNISYEFQKLPKN